MLPTFKSFYNNTLKTLKESVNLNSLPDFKDRITIENGEKVIRGSVDFSYQQLTELPDLSDVKVLGGFNCSYNRLQTLKGAPKYVSGNFYCSNNQLQTLKGAPKYVSGNFYCNSNQLQTLEGAPKHIGVFFSCDNNSQLTTLKGLPKYIGGDLCWHDTKVTMEDFYENLLLSDVKGNPMYQDEDEGDHNYPESPMSNEEAYVNAEAYGIYNTPSEYTIDF
jgi:hypothetical protein